MEINTKINASLESLNAYNEIYPWIPNEYQIRPTDMIRFIKNNLMGNIFNEFHSTRDYILVTLLNMNAERIDKKIKVIENYDKLNKFEVCRFRYQIDSSAFHYIMWYNCSKDDLTDEEITKDINNGIYNIIKSDNYSFVWYENPKMTINDVFHVQVFWVKLV